MSSDKIHGDLKGGGGSIGVSESVLAYHIGEILKAAFLLIITRRMDNPHVVDDAIKNVEDTLRYQQATKSSSQINR